MKKLLLLLKHIFIPHEGNDKQPHLLRSKATALIMAVSIALELLVLVALFPIFGKGLDFIAAVLPGVLVDETNKTRLAYNLNTLERNPLLEQAAQLKADDMAARGYFAHNTPEGEEPWVFLEDVGYTYETAGENLAVNFSDSMAAHEAWMNSPGHRANIVRNSFTEIGIATARGEYEGRNTIFVVQFFGKPRVVVPNQVVVAPVQIPAPTPVSVPIQQASLLLPTIPNPVIPPAGQTPEDLNVASESVRNPVEREETKVNEIVSTEIKLPQVVQDAQDDQLAQNTIEDTEMVSDVIEVSNTQDIQVSDLVVETEKTFIGKVLDSIGRFANGVAELIKNITIAMLGERFVVQRDIPSVDINTGEAVQGVSTTTFASTGTPPAISENVEFTPKSSFISKIASSPRTFSAYVFGILSLIILATLFLKVIVHIKVQYLTLILNGILILVILFSFLLINHELAMYYGKVL